MDDNGPRRVRLRGGGPRAQDRDRPGPRTTRWPVPADFPPPLASADPGLRSASAVSSPAPPVTYPAARSCPCAGFALHARRGGQFQLEGDVPAVAIRHREGRVMTAPDYPAGPAVCADPSPPGRPDRVRRAPRPPPGTATAPSRGTCAATTARPPRCAACSTLPRSRRSTRQPLPRLLPAQTTCEEARRPGLGRPGPPTGRPVPPAWYEMFVCSGGSGIRSMAVTPC
jgi:hypothetical protein